MLLMPGGRFTMGYDDASPAQSPAHDVELSSYWIDSRAVTNADFARFVRATGYKTSAEQLGRSWVFNGLRGKWLLLAGAHWLQPVGPGGHACEPQKPVVQVSWHDAVAYCSWLGKRLPTEAEWERAARGQYARLSHAGDVTHRFNRISFGVPGATEQSPDHSPGSSGGTVPGIGASVWEWCSDWYAEDYYQYSPPENPRGPHRGRRRVQRGDARLHAELTGAEVWTRERLAPHAAHNFAGFRCAMSRDAA